MKYDPKVTSIPGLQANLHNHFVVQGRKVCIELIALSGFAALLKIGENAGVKSPNLLEEMAAILILLKIIINKIAL